MPRLATRFTTEFKVGLFVVAATIILIAGAVLTSDSLRIGGREYLIYVTVPTADGLYEGTPVKLAGVQIGAVDEIALAGNRALLTLAIQQAYEIPIDSHVEIRSSGIIGDRYVLIVLGTSELTIPDGGVIAFGEDPGDIDVITRNVEAITEDLRVITAGIREIVENEQNRENIEQTLENVEVLTRDLRTLVAANKDDVDAIIASVRRFTDQIEEIAEDVGPEITSASGRLDRSLENVESITSKIDRGEGTLGALVNDDRTIVALNETLEEIRTVVESFSKLHAEVYYIGRVYVGTQPDRDPFFFGNPVAPNLDGGLGLAGSNTIGVELHPQEDFWWIFEINDYPMGRITAEERFFPDQGVHWFEYRRAINFRFTFMMAKRWHDIAFRLGLKENGGGVGATYYLLDDRLTLWADVFDFKFGSYPAVDDEGIPNLRLAARLEPIDHVWLEAGAEQVILGAKHGYFTGFVGAGFHFTDDDIKLLLALLPLDF